MSSSSSAPPNPPALLFVHFISHVYLSRAIFCQSLLGAGASENPERGDRRGHGETSRPHRQFPIPSASGASGTQLAPVSSPGLLLARGKEKLSHTPRLFRRGRGRGRFHHVVPGQLPGLLSPHPCGGEEERVHKTGGRRGQAGAGEEEGHILYAIIFMAERSMLEAISMKFLIASLPPALLMGRTAQMRAARTLVLAHCPCCTHYF